MINGVWGLCLLCPLSLVQDACVESGLISVAGSIRSQAWGLCSRLLSVLPAQGTFCLYLSQHIAKQQEEARKPVYRKEARSKSPHATRVAGWTKLSFQALSGFPCLCPT